MSLPHNFFPLINIGMPEAMSFMPKSDESLAKVSAVDPPLRTFVTF